MAHTKLGISECSRWGRQGCRCAHVWIRFGTTCSQWRSSRVWIRHAIYLGLKNSRFPEDWCRQLSIMLSNTFMTESNLGSLWAHSSWCRVGDIKFNLSLTLPISSAKVADMYTRLNASRSYVYAVARACDRGKISRKVRFEVVAELILDCLFWPGLCWCNLVFNGEGRRSCPGGNAVLRRERLH